MPRPFATITLIALAAAVTAPGTASTAARPSVPEPVHAAIPARPNAPGPVHAATFLPASLGFGDLQVPATLRVRLLEQLAPRTLSVDAPAGGLQVFAGSDERPELSVAQGTRLTLTVSGRDVRVATGSKTAQSSAIRLASPAGEAITLLTGSATRSYRGDIHAAADGATGVLRLINHVPLEDYVASVVASEYGLDDLEGSKAMAVIARTYALKALKNADYDQTDHTLSQVYKGTRTVTARALEAAQATRGEVLTHAGDLIVATYYSSSGGHTANNEDVWQAQPLPYLRGRQDAWDGLSPHRGWTYEMTTERMHAMIRDAFGITPRSVEVEHRSADGRARTLRIRAEGGRDRSISSQEFRLQVIRTFGPTALRSTMFSLDPKGDKYVFTGSGFGHGVGLSQWGAHAMALEGRAYRDILDYYYQGVKLERATPASADDDPIEITQASPRDFAPPPAMTLALAPPRTTTATQPSTQPSTRPTASTSPARVASNPPAGSTAGTRPRSNSDAQPATSASGRPAGWTGPVNPDRTNPSTGRVISRRVGW